MLPLSAKYLPLPKLTSNDFFLILDGSSEEKKVTKDNEGRETTKVIKRSGEDCYTVTTIKHPDGREEREESNICPKLNDFNRTFKQQFGDQESLVDKIFRF